jgi:ubiquitin-activating enzyme E1
LTDDSYKNYNLICITHTNQTIGELTKLDQFCRENKIGFILAETLGLAGFIFVDYGEHHIVTDLDGEPCK